MDFSALTTTQVVLLGAVVAGATEFIGRLRAKDYWVAATIFTAAILGGLIGLHFHVDFFDGVMVGLGTSGTFSAIGMIKGKSAPSPSTLLTRTVPAKTTTTTTPTV